MRGSPARLSAGLEARASLGDVLAVTSPLDAPERRRERAATPRAPGPRWGGLGLLLLGSGVPLLVVAVATVTGLGLLRNLPSLASVLAALSLVVLPIAGIVALLGSRGGRLAAWGGGAWLWSLSLLLVIPFYFPGERREAAAVGLDLFFEPAGSPVREGAPGLRTTVPSGRQSAASSIKTESGNASSGGSASI